VARRSEARVGEANGSLFRGRLSQVAGWGWGRLDVPLEDLDI
jgi:hypothetical protein